MEDRWHGPEDPTNEDLETTRKKRRGTDFLSQYLLRRREQQGENIEEEDDEESEEKPKKFRRFFKGLFKRVVELPTDSKEPAPKSLSLESLFLGGQEKQEASQEHNEEARPTQETEPPFQPVEAAATAVTETPEPVALEHPYEHAEAPQSASQPERAEIADQALEQTPRLSERDSIELPVAERPVPADHTVFERAQPQPVVEKEVVIERGPGMVLPVVLVGAEYLARKKADRKLDTKYDERVGRIETENKREKISKEQLTTLVKQNREQLEALKRDRGIETARTEKRQSTEQMRPSIEQQPERKPQPNIERQVPQSTPEKNTNTETYKIMEQVAKAAEQDVPVERVFERSHEVKDNQSIPIVGAASIGAIMTDQVAKQQYTRATAQQSSKDVSGLPIMSDKVQTAAYKQAMQRGFWTAIIIIILGTLAYLLK